jgi:hypothetical protein
LFTGTYERSCFGSSIEALVYISVPVREIPVGRLMELVRAHSVKIGTEPNIMYTFFIPTVAISSAEGLIEINNNTHE